MRGKKKIGGINFVAEEIDPEEFWNIRQLDKINVSPESVINDIYSDIY